jgi:predicted DNA-binding transcriptional regulator AlpA
MARKVDPDELIGSSEVAEILGLSHTSGISTYVKRYEDFPGPVVDLPRSRVRLWLRPEIERWDSQRSKRRGRPPRE